MKYSNALTKALSTTALAAIFFTHSIGLASIPDNIDVEKYESLYHGAKQVSDSKRAIANQIDSEINSTVQQNDQTRADISKNDNDVSKLNQYINELNYESDRLSEQISKLNSEIDHNQRSIRTNRSQIRNLKVQLNQINVDLSQITQRYNKVLKRKNLAKGDLN